MATRQMSRKECLLMLGATRLARLACAHDNQPYVVPVYVAYHEPPEGGPYLYGFTVPGQKLDWMRANPRVCVEVDEVETADRWKSVIAMGSFEELPETTRQNDRMQAYQLLQTQTRWWQPGYSAFEARTHPDALEPYNPIYYRVRIDVVTGHETTPDSYDSILQSVPATFVGKWGWLGRTLTRVFGGNPPSSSSTGESPHG